MFNELLDQIESLLLGRISIESLEDWLVLNLQRILDSTDERTIALANRLDSDLIQYSDGVFDKLTLFDHLQSYALNAREVGFSYGDPHSISETKVTSASDGTVRRIFELSPEGEAHFQATLA